jgi:hypothetical protein
MRLNLALAVPVAALLLACGDGSDLPSGHWSPQGQGSGSPPAGSSTGSGGSGSSSSSSTGSSSSSGGSSGTSSSGSGGIAGSSSGSSSTSSGGSSSSSGMAAPPNLGVTLDHATVQTQLMAQTVIMVSVAPNGYSGSVQLQAAMLPAGVEAAFNPATLALDGSATGTSQLTLTTASDAPPATASVEVDATAAGTTARSTVSVEVQSVITIHIPAGVDNNGGTTGNPVTSAYGPYPIKVTAPQNISAQTPVTVYFMNDDGTSHEIHADAPDQGFGHDPGPFSPHTMDPYVRNVNAVGSYDFYLHDQGGPSTLGLLEIQ